MAVQIQVRRDTTANWAAANPVIPAAGEPCMDTDTGTVKWGDGATTYANLPLPAGTGGGGYTFVQTTTPVGAVEDDTWLDPSVWADYVYYNDGVTTSWVSTPSGASSAQQIDTAVECIWTGTTWTTNSGSAVPTSATLLRTYRSLNDPAADAPLIYNANDVWFKAV